MAVKRVVFIRPGETEWNKIGRWQGIVGVPLNGHGRAQAERLAKFVRNINLDALYSSDLRRAKDTAAAGDSVRPPGCRRRSRSRR